MHEAPIAIARMIALAHDHWQATSGRRSSLAMVCRLYCLRLGGQKSGAADLETQLARSFAHRCGPPL